MMVAELPLPAIIVASTDPNCLTMAEISFSEYCRNLLDQRRTAVVMWKDAGSEAFNSAFFFSCWAFFAARSARSAR